MLQAAFGMWTVTLKLWPQVVTTHLLGGFATLSLLWLLYLRVSQTAALAARYRTHAVVALAVVIAQVFARRLDHLELCSARLPRLSRRARVIGGHRWMPPMDSTFSRTLVPIISVGCWTMQRELRFTWATASARWWCFWWWGRSRLRLVSNREGKTLAIAMLALLIGQICLGIANVVFTLPLAVATAHNGTGALLLLGVITVNYRSFRAGASPMSELAAPIARATWRDYLEMCKPRVVLADAVVRDRRNVSRDARNGAPQRARFRYARHRVGGSLCGRGQSHRRCADRRANGAHAPSPRRDRPRDHKTGFGILGGDGHRGNVDALSNSSIRLRRG